MSNLIKPDEKIDAFEGFTDTVEGAEQQQSRGVIHGGMLKFTNEATWTCGGDKLAPDCELVAVDIARILQKWHDQAPVETIVLEPHQKIPDVAKLNSECPKSEWVEAPGGELRGPWQAQTVVYFVDPSTMARYSWPTGTIGGQIATRALVDQTKWMRRFRGSAVYPVVRFADKFMNTKFGGRQRPHLNIVRWIALDGGGDGTALPKPEAAQIESKPAPASQGGARIVEPPTCSEEMDDRIAY